MGYTADCHGHAKAQAVVGIKDIVYALDESDRTIRMESISITSISL